MIVRRQRKDPWRRSDKYRRKNRVLSWQRSNWRLRTRWTDGPRIIGMSDDKFHIKFKNIYKFYPVIIGRYEIWMIVNFTPRSPKVTQEYCKVDLKVLAKFLPIIFIKQSTFTPSGHSKQRLPRPGVPRQLRRNELTINASCSPCH